MINPEIIKPIISEIYSKRYSNWKSSPTNINITKLHSGPYTDAFKCYVSNKNFPSLFVKCKINEDKISFNRDEYDFLSRLWNNCYDASKRLCIPEPIAFIEEKDLLVTNFVEGTLLSKHLTSFFYFSHIYNSKNIKNLISRVIDWLVDYERKLSNELRAVESSLFIEKYLDSKIDEISLIDNDLKQSLKRKLVNSTKKVTHFQIYPINSDFNPNNIIISEEKITVIDWEKSMNDGLSFWMPSTFLRYIHKYKNRIGTSSKKLENLCTFFRNEYLSKTLLGNDSSNFEFVYALQNITYLCESSVNSTSMTRLQKNCLSEILKYVHS